MEQPLPNIVSPDQPIWSRFLGAKSIQSPLNRTGNAFVASGNARQLSVGNINTTFTGRIEKVETHYHGDAEAIAMACHELLLATTITKFNANESVRNYPSTAADVEIINNELSELQKVLELLNTNSEERVPIPESLEMHVMTVLDNCKSVVSQVNTLLESNSEDGESSKPAGSREQEMVDTRRSLATHRISLNLALQLISLSLAQATQQCTTEIRGEVVSVKQDTGLIAVILEELGQLRSIVANSTTSNNVGDHSYMLDRYLSSLSSYAESICDDGIQFPGRSELLCSSPPPLSEMLESLASDLGTLSDAHSTNKSGKRRKKNMKESLASPLRASTPVQQDLQNIQDAPSNEHDTDLKLIAPWEDWIRFEHLPANELVPNFQRATFDSKNKTKESIATPAIHNPEPHPVVEDIKRKSSKNKDSPRTLPWESWTGFGSLRSIKLENLRKTKDLSDSKLKLVMAGDSWCGKSALVMRWVNNAWVDVLCPRIWENYQFDCTLDGDQIEISLFDTPGDNCYDRVRPLTYPDTHAIMLCFSIDSTDTVDNIIYKWKKELDRHCSGVPVILVGLKKDVRLETSIVSAANRSLVTWEKGDSLRKKIQAKAYLECSSKTGEGVNEVLEEATRIASGLLIQEKKNKRRRSIWPFGRSGL